MGRAYSCWMLNWWCITWPGGFNRLIHSAWNFGNWLFSVCIWWKLREICLLCLRALAGIEIHQPRNISLSKVGVVTATLLIDGHRIDTKSNKTYLKYHFYWMSTRHCQKTIIWTTSRKRLKMYNKIIMDPYTEYLHRVSNVLQPHPQAKSGIPPSLRNSRCLQNPV